MRKKLSPPTIGIYCASLALCTLLLAPQAQSRTLIVNGSLSTGVDFTERSFDDDFEDSSDSGDAEDLSIGPEIEILYNGIHDQLTFRYAPTLVYDNIESETELDHYLAAEWTWQASRAWQIEMSDNFVFSDDYQRFGSAFEAPPPEDDTPPPPSDEITGDLGRRRYWTNSLELATTYTYAKESDARIGYVFRVLRNDSGSGDGGFDEYDRHIFSASVGHYFNASWQSLFEVDYVKGLFEEETSDGLSADVDEFGTEVTLTYVKNVSNSFPFTYLFNSSQFEDDRSDNSFHELTAGWNHAFDVHSNIEIGIGGSYAESDDLDGEFGYTGYVRYIKRYRHGRIEASISNGFTPNNFSGGEDTGLTDVTALTLVGTYDFTKDLSSRAFAEYSYERNVDPQGAFLEEALEGEDPTGQEAIDDVEYTSDSYSAGASLNYTFLRDYIASFGYVFYKQEGDLIGDSYTDHRLTLSLTFRKELWR